MEPSPICDTANDRTTKNIVYLLRRKAQGNINYSLYGVSRMADAIDEIQRSSDRMRWSLRAILPAGMSETLVPESEKIIDKAFEDACDELYVLFTQELDKAVAELQRCDGGKWRLTNHPSHCCRQHAGEQLEE